MFSARLPHDLTPNRLTSAIDERRRAGRPLLDLTVTNPTAVGIHYPDDALVPLGDAAARSYRPEPFGLSAAREAVSRDYGRLGTTVAPERIVLTASTSEAYSVLFKLLCDPGDDVLIPAPSYPLFDHLSALDGVRAYQYRLEYHGGWTLDEESVEAAWTAGTRAVLAVNPNNPTGSFLAGKELDFLDRICTRRGAALIIDEVFADYPLADSSAPAARNPAAALTFRLGGLSKSAGLPQVKLGWIAVEGPDDLAAQSLARLEIICDTYLSVSTPVQMAAATLIQQGADTRAQILSRVRRNHTALRAAVANAPSLQLLQSDAGWAAVLRIPSTRSEEDAVLELLERDSVLVHPGYFFDFSHEAFLIVSLLPPPDVFDQAVARLVKRVHG
jgi:alanine-synthesizing transaminase